MQGLERQQPPVGRRQGGAKAEAETPGLGLGQLAGLPNVFTAQFPTAALQGGPRNVDGGGVAYDEEGAGAGGSMMDDTAEGTAPMSVEPLLRLPAEPGAGVEAVLECGANGGRQLLSFSVAFPRVAVAMGDACPLTLRVVSHWPLPLRASRLLLRFNKDYLGAVTVVDAGGPAAAADRWRASLAQPPPAPTPASSSSSGSDDHQEVDETGTARARLLLRPDAPLDLRLAVPVPTHELVEVGDLLHALSLHVSLDPLPSPTAPVLPCGARPFPGPFTLTVPSGVACLDRGVKAANVCCRAAAGAGGEQLVVAQPSSLPVPLHASLRGFPAVEIIRPLASATLGLARLLTTAGTVPPPPAAKPQ